MKTNRKLIVIFLLTSLAVAGVVAAINYFSMIAKILVKGVSTKTQEIIEDFKVVKNIETNLSLAKIYTTKRTPAGMYLEGEFNATNNLSVFVYGIKIAENFSTFNMTVGISPNMNKNLGTNVLIALVTTNETNSNMPIEDLIKDIYGKNAKLKLKYYENMLDFYVLNYTFCEPEDKSCDIYLNNLKSSLGNGRWFDVIVVTDGPSENETFYWNMLVKVWH